MKPTGNTSIFRANPRGLFSCTILDSRHAFFRNHPHALREFHHPPPTRTAPTTSESWGCMSGWSWPASQSAKPSSPLSPRLRPTQCPEPVSHPVREFTELVHGLAQGLQGPLSEGDHRRFGLA